MELTDQQRREVAASIRVLDGIQPEYDKSFEAYDSAKIKCGYSAFVSGMLFLGVISGNYEIKEMIGSLGVGLLPFVFVGAIVYYFSVRKKYHTLSSNKLDALDPLFKLGISYTPVGRNSSAPRLIILKTRAQLNIEAFK